MAKKKAEETLGGYDASGSKKGPILAVYIQDVLEGYKLLQFDPLCTYEFRKVSGEAMLVVKKAGEVCAHVKQHSVLAVVCPQYIIRDKDAH